MQRFLAIPTFLALGLPLDAHASAAESPSDATASATVDQREAQDPTPNTSAVELRYQEAQERYTAGDLRGALEILEECHASTGSTNLLFNIAQLYRELGDCSPAIAHYERYLTAAPEGERVADARNYIEQLRPNCNREPAPAPQPPPPPPTPLRDKPLPSTNYWIPVGWVALGVGAVAVAGTIYSAVETNHASRDIEQMPNNDGFQYSDYLERNDDFYRYRNWAFAFGVTSAITTAIGVYALAVAAPRQRRQQSISLSIKPTSATVGYTLQF